MSQMKSAVLLVAFALASSGMAANCKKGKPCGNSCIPVSSTCRIDTSSPSTPTLPITPPVTPVPSNPVVLPPSTTWATRYGSCSDARAAGDGDIPTSSPNYHPDLDRDKDGLACERGGDDNGASIPNWQPSAGTGASAVNTPAFQPSFKYDFDAKVGTLAFGCAQEVEFTFIPMQPFSKLAFSIDRWQGGDWLMRVLVGSKEVYATSLDSTNRNLAVGQQTARTPVKIIYKALSENQSCPTDVRIRNLNVN